MTAEAEIEMMTIAGEVRRLVAEHGRLSVPMEQVGDDDDLFNAGMTSHATVGVMFALEDSFDVEFPEDMLNLNTFQTVNALTEALSSLLQAKKAAEIDQRS